MSYRDKAPTVISILTRKLKPGKTFEDFQKAHVPSGDIDKSDVGYDVDFFTNPTRVINAISIEDPSVIYSIGLSYGDLNSILEEAIEKSKVDRAPGGRGPELDKICDYMMEPFVAIVGSDNNYGGKDPEYEQIPLPQMSPELVDAIKKIKEAKK